MRYIERFNLGKLELIKSNVLYVDDDRIIGRQNMDGDGWIQEKGMVRNKMISYYPNLTQFFPFQLSFELCIHNSVKIDYPEESVSFPVQNRFVSLFVHPIIPHRKAFQFLSEQFKRLHSRNRFRDLRDGGIISFVSILSILIVKMVIERLIFFNCNFFQQRFYIQ